MVATIGSVVVVFAVVAMDVVVVLAETELAVAVMVMGYADGDSRSILEYRSL